MTTSHVPFTRTISLCLKFSKLYQSGDIPGSCKLYMLQLTDASLKLFEALDA